MKTLLFFDPKSLSREDAALYLDSIPMLLAPRNVECRAIDFFSSLFDDLSVVSALRVVALPTIVILGDDNRVILRVVGQMPDTVDIAHYISTREEEEINQ